MKGWQILEETEVMPYLSIADSYRSEAELREQELTDMRLRLLEKDAKVNELAAQLNSMETKLAGFVVTVNALLVAKGVSEGILDGDAGDVR